MAASKRFVYLLQSLRSPNEVYIGVTSDVERRLDAHNSGCSPHTAKHRLWRVLITVEFPAEPRAVAFEKYLKSGSGRAFAKRHFE